MTFQEKLDQFYGKKFRHDGKEFKVVDVCIRENKAVIRTNKRTFVYYESELVLFMNSIEFIVHANLQEWKPKEVPVVSVINTETNSEKVNTKLMEMFDTICQNPTKENIDKADAMVRVSDAMVKNELIRLRFLTIK
jgi:hypothetical protein